MSPNGDDTSNESKQELAQDRTDWAQERTLLAKERTFSAWGRTGLASMAAGMAIARFLGSESTQGIARLAGSLLIFTGGLIFLLGFISYRKALQKLAEQGVRGTPLWVMALITLTLVVCAVLAMVMIFQE